MVMTARDTTILEAVGESYELLDHTEVGRACKRVRFYPGSHDAWTMDGEYAIKFRITSDPNNWTDIAIFTRGRHDDRYTNWLRGWHQNYVSPDKTIESWATIPLKSNAERGMWTVETECRSSSAGGGGYGGRKIGEASFDLEIRDTIRTSVHYAFDEVEPNDIMQVIWTGKGFDQVFKTKSEITLTKGQNLDLEAGWIVPYRYRFLSDYINTGKCARDECYVPLEATRVYQDETEIPFSEPKKNFDRHRLFLFVRGKEHGVKEVDQLFVIEHAGEEFWSYLWLIGVMLTYIRPELCTIPRTITQGETEDFVINCYNHSEKEGERAGGEKIDVRVILRDSNGREYTSGWIRNQTIDPEEERDITVPFTTPGNMAEGVYTVYAELLRSS